MTRRALIKAAPALSIAVATALRGETAKDRGKRLIESTIQGMGGDAFRNMRTRTEIGRASSFYREQITGFSVAHIYTKCDAGPAVEAAGSAAQQSPASAEPIRQLQRQAFGKKMEDAVIFTQTEAYEVTFRGARPLADDKISQYHDTTLHDIFYILRERLDEPGVEFEGTGIDVVENQPVETIEIYDSENRNITVWVNSDFFVPVRQRFYRWDPTINDRHEEVTLYTKYRQVGGIMWPFAISRQRDGGMTYNLQSEHVTINDALPDSMFELPNGIKILKK
jgi:hypothetical protein